MNKLLMFLFIFMASPGLFADVDSSPLDRSDYSKPIVYTGIATLAASPNVTPGKFITRLHLIPSNLSTQGAPKYSATVIFHLSSDASNEYLTINYPKVTLNRAKREIILTDGQKPVIIFSFDQSRSNATGRFINQSRDAGTISLKNGWDYPKDVDVEQNYGGIYDATCPNIRMASAGTYHLKQIIIAPNRLSPNIEDVNPIYNDASYIGSANCDTIGDEACHTFKNGRVLALEKELVLFEFGNSWNCKRTIPGELKCTSQNYDCNLKKIREIHQPLSPITLSFGPVFFDANQSLLQNPDGKTVDCAKWNGRRFGMLQHRLGARRQPVNLDFASWSEVDDDGHESCAVKIQADLNFYTYSEVPEHIVYAFPTSYVRPLDDGVVIRSVSPIEISLEVWIDKDGIIHGYWISNIFGYVGPIEFVTADGYSRLPQPTIQTGMFGLSGDFTESKDKNISFSLRAYPRAKEIDYHPNPYNAVEIEGGMSLLPGWPQFHINRKAYYDYYTNYLMMTVGDGINIGQIDVPTTGLHLLNFSLQRHAKQGHAFNKTDVYLRSMGGR